MPTYEYECTKCQFHFERFQSMTAEPLKRCPKCRGKVHRLLGTGAGIIFKGSGFYQTDYRSESYKQKAKSDSSAATSSSSEKKDSGDKPKSTETVKAAKKD
jgi:putative FmdB family regulatory protein